MQEASTRPLRGYDPALVDRVSALRHFPLRRGIGPLVTGRFLRYAAVGSCAALLQILLLSFLVEFGNVHSVAASTSALAVSVLFNYSLQRRVTFRSKAKHMIAGPRFVLLTLGTLSANAVLFGALDMVFPYLISQVLTMGALFPINYHLNRTITFAVP